MSTLSYPKTTLSWTNTNASYVIVTYKGNTVATSGNVVSTAQYGTSYTTGDLSYNTLYTFTLTSYNSIGAAGATKTLTFDTTPKYTGAYVSNVRSASVVLNWSGSGTWSGGAYSYVKISRKKSTETGYVDISTGVVTVPYYDLSLSGNTTYNYYITPYDTTGNQLAPGTVFSVTTKSQAPYDLSAIYTDVSGFMLRFTLPSNSYTSTYYYLVRTYNTSLTRYTDTSGTSSPITVTNLSGGTTYVCYITTYLDGTAGANSTWLSVTTPSLYTQNALYIFMFNSGDINGSNYVANYASGSGVFSSSITSSSATISTSVYKLGTSSLYLNGSANISFSSTFTFPANGYTWCCWFYSTATAVSQKHGLFSMLSTTSYTNSYGSFLAINYQGTNRGTCYTVRSNGGSSYGVNFTASTTSYQTWTHYALVVSKTNSTATLYINGSYYSQSAITYPSTSTTMPYCYIGTVGDESTGTGFTGYMDDWRLYSGEVSATVISNIYNGYY